MNTSPPLPGGQPKFTFELVQILRGFAALMVVGYHTHLAMQQVYQATPAKGIFALGLFGVDFFFVLSGFIITYIHVNDIRFTKPVMPFVRKRFFRIYPIYWVTALITLLYVLTVEKGKLEYTGHTLSGTNVNDWLYVIKSLFLLPQPAIAIVDVSWTLSFELLFYFVFALTIVGGWKFARIVFFVWLALILSLAFGLWSSKDYYVNFVLNPLIIEFLMGCVLAYVFKMQSIKLTVPLFLLITVVLGSIAFVYLRLMHHQFGRDGWNYVLIIGGAMLAIWSSATIDRSQKFRKFRWGLLLLLGNASYSIYLVHTLIIRVIFKLIPSWVEPSSLISSSVKTNLLFAGVSVLTALIGIVVHVFLEQPLLAYTNRKFVPERQASH